LSIVPYALATFLSAFLLFAVEPLIGKALLPWFGGVPAVWTTCMLFFQILLLAGYGYAHLLSTACSPRRQRQIHLGLMVLALAWMALLFLVGGSPLIPSAAWRPPDSSHPTGRVLVLLAASIGLPFLILSANAPLIQAWWGRTRPEGRVYRLYALSNTGSLLALLCYPTLIEPHLPLSSQAKGWAAAFLIFIVVAGGCALLAEKTAIQVAPGLSPACAAIKGGATSSTGAALKGGVTFAAGAGLKPDATLQRGLWLLLPAGSSCLLLAATNQMCQEVAVIPFLWVLPLALYLITFILCFASERWYPRRVYWLALVAAIIVSTGMLYRGNNSRVPLQVGVYSFLLFAGCMVCHGELVRIKPPSSQSTLFYFWVSLGGVLGGLAVCLGAPNLLSGYFEFHISILLVASLGLLALAVDRSSWLYQKSSWPAALTLFCMAVLPRFMADYDKTESLAKTSRTILLGWPSYLVLVFVVGVMFAAWLGRRTTGHPIVASWMLLAALASLGYTLRQQVVINLKNRLYSRRNFFGALFVVETAIHNPLEHSLELHHGQITHGIQFVAADRRDLATTYYGPTSGVGYALLHHPKRPPLGLPPGTLRVGVVGLGTGTLAAYCRPGDLFRFYEINPLVRDLSWNPKGYFSYIKDCVATKELVMGDARLSLEREFLAHGSNHFDLLAVDAFSSDAIPVHLLTEEAIALYLKHLNPIGGILAIHISNQNLDLAPVVWQLADHFGLSAVFVSDENETDVDWKSDWFLLSPDHYLLSREEFRQVMELRPAISPRMRLWTDDYSNLFQIMRWRTPE
jgi:hypothetical protein